MIDPGHNVRNRLHPTEINRPVFYGIPGRTKPCDTTGTATASGFTEAKYNLEVGIHAVRILRDMGATVIMTRVDRRPWGPCITRRAALGNINHADAAVSIHADGSPASVHGFYVIAPSTPLPGVGLGPKRIARDVHLGAAMLKAFHHVTRMPISNLYTTGFLRSDAYGGTNLSHVPKIFARATCPAPAATPDSEEVTRSGFHARIWASPRASGCTSPATSKNEFQPAGCTTGPSQTRTRPVSQSMTIFAPRIV